MFIYFQSILCHVLSLLLLVSFMNIYLIKATSWSSLASDNKNSYVKQAEEYVMTSAIVNGIKRSNVCGDGYRIEGVLLKSYPFSNNETYLPYEDCSMTFQARRLNNQIRIRFITLDINDIHGGMNCLDSLRFYKSAYVTRQDKLDTVECGQLTEAENFSIISPTGIVTAHFSTDGGNVSGLGFEVILTAFRYANETYQCNSDGDEYLCNNDECISNLLLCDGIAHCLDGSDEMPYYSCSSNALESLTNVNIVLNNPELRNKHYQWRGIIIIAFLLIIFIVFTFFMAYFVCHRCIHRPMPLMNNERKNYATIVNSPFNRPKNSVTTQIILKNNNKNQKRLDDDYNFL